jgi:hypothetical protein
VAVGQLSAHWGAPHSVCLADPEFAKRVGKHRRNTCCVSELTFPSNQPSLPALSVIHREVTSLHPRSRPTCAEQWSKQGWARYSPNASFHHWSASSFVELLSAWMTLLRSGNSFPLKVSNLSGCHSRGVSMSLSPATEGMYLDLVHS